MDLGIENKVMIVTGGSKGIGEGITRALAAEGAIPVIATRDKESAEQLVKELKSRGKEANFIQVELSPKENCKRVVDETLQKYQRIDALINNAGVNDGVGLGKGDPEKFLASLNKNLHHYYYLAHYALDALKKSRGSIVNISSKTAVTGQGNTSGYAASKGAQLALTREWAVELLPYGIRVNAVIPAEVMTPLYEKWIQTFDEPQKKLSEIVKNIPLGQRMTTKEEIASMVAYLVSEQASHITGQWIFVDGGYVHLDRALAGVK
ncbi:MAG: SDR family oxidoreductase [Bacteroidota bacterium]|nr:SDR family oxidoreductase [Bacteroidota bacterium]